MEPQQAPDRRSALLFTGAALLLTFAWARFPSRFSGDPWILFVCCGTVLLAASRFRNRHPLYLELGLLAFPVFDRFFFQSIHPSTSFAAVDELLWVFDRSFGYPQIPLTRFLLSAGVLFPIMKLVWLSLPLMFVAAYLALPKIVRARYVATIVGAGLMILPLYAACPGAGPVYLFGDNYPGAVPLLSHPHPVYLHPGIELNTTPSGHLAWALLVFWFTYRYCRKRVAAVFAVLAVLIVISTLGLGEHYVIDLVLAFPFAAAVWSITSREWKRAALLLAVTIVWLVALRQGWLLAAPAPLVWMLSGVTMATAGIGKATGAACSHSEGSSDRLGALVKTPVSEVPSSANFG